MAFSLWSLFAPNFDSIDAIIKMSHFCNSWNVLSIKHINQDDDICEMIFKLILSRVSYENEYHKKYDINTLTIYDVDNICDTLNTSNFSQKDWLIAELILKDFRTHTHCDSNNYINQPLHSYRIQWTTTTGEDLLEIIFENESWMFLMRDARNDKNKWVNAALTSKLKELYSKKRSVVEDSIRIVWEKNNMEVDEIISNKAKYSEEKCIFILTWNNNIDDFQSFIDKKINSPLAKPSTKMLFQEIKNWIEMAHYVIIHIDNYSEIFETIKKDITMPFLREKLMTHATI